VIFYLFISVLRKGSQSHIAYSSRAFFSQLLEAVW